MAHKRQTKFELLRIIAMIFICGHHYIYYGVMQNYNNEIANQIYSSGLLFNKLYSQILLPGGVIGVNIFFLIMGFFGISHNKGKCFSVVVETFCYSLLGVGIAYLFQLDSVSNSWKILLTYFAPVSNSIYWFVSVYILISLMKPTLNKYIRENKNYKTILVFGMVCYCASKVVHAYYMGLVRGLLLYYIGAIIALNERKFLKSKYSYLAYALLGWCVYIIMMNVAEFNLPSVVGDIGICIFGIVSSVSIFLAFTKLSDFTNNLINTIAGSTFAVYLLHEHPMLREFIWSRILHVESIQFRSSYFVLCSFASIVFVFIISIIIDFLYKTLLSRCREHLRSLI